MKRLGISVLVSLAVNLLIMGVNYLYYQSNHWLLIAHKVFGGEITVEFSPGLAVSHIYAMTMEGHDSIRLRFEPFSLLICVAVLALLIFLALTLADRMLQRKVG